MSKKLSQPINTNALTTTPPTAKFFLLFLESNAAQLSPSAKTATSTTPDNNFPINCGTCGECAIVVKATLPTKALGSRIKETPASTTPTTAKRSETTTSL